MTSIGALTGSQAQGGRHVMGHGFRPGMAGAAHARADATENSIAQSQKFLSERLSQRLADKLNTSNNAATAVPVVPPTNAEEDFSPASVADRILGFIENRLNQEKAAGASDDVLHQRFKEGLDGVRQGMEEARQELEKRGMFEGAVRDDYFDTFGRVQQGLDTLKEQFLGDSTGVSQGNPTVTQTTGSRTILESQTTAISESREFDMEVKTQDGDVVRISVSSQRDFSAMLTRLQTDDMDANAFSSEFTASNAFSFEVEGELDEGEISALKDLFSQVNDVAATFYGGDVEAAFDQALSVGYDQNELAGFAANMTQSQSVAVTQAYTDVANAGGGSVGSGENSPLRALMDFARAARAAHQNLQGAVGTFQNGDELFRQLLSQLPAGTAAPVVSDAQAVAEPASASSAPPWSQFIDGVLNDEVLAPAA